MISYWGVDHGSEEIAKKQSFQDFKRQYKTNVGVAREYTKKDPELRKYRKKELATSAIGIGSGIGYFAAWAAGKNKLATGLATPAAAGMGAGIYYSLKRSDRTNRLLQKDPRAKNAFTGKKYGSLGV